MKKNYTVSIKASKIYKQKLIVKIAKVTFLFLLVVFSIMYFLLYVLYSKSNFVVSLDPNASNRKNIFLSEDGSYENMAIELRAKSLDTMDNISVNWIDEDVDNEGDGSHNGDNYMAYSFYVINYGSDTVNYWYQVDLSDIVKDVDEAIRVMIYRNGEKTIYGKKNQETGKEESGTEGFYSDSIAVMEQVQSFEPGDKDRYTVVIWLEGDDPDCTDDILGGQVKLQMNITEEHTNNDE